MNKPKQRRIGCRQQRKRKFRITYDLNVETWINEEVSRGEIIRNERKVSQSPLPWETSANGEINELCYLPKTPKRLIDPDVNQETSKQLSHSLLRVYEMTNLTIFLSWIHGAVFNSCRRLVQAAQLKGKFPFSEKALSVIAWPSTGNSLTYWFSLSRRMLRQKWQNQVKDATL